MFTHILIPTDGSPASARAIRAGIALAKALDAKVTGYSGVGPQPYGHYGQPVFVDERLAAKAERAILAAAEQRVAQIASAARRAGVPFKAVVARALPTYEGILSAARANRCDAIFMASHGRRALKRFLVGSVTQQVLARSSIPVLVFR